MKNLFCYHILTKDRYAELINETIDECSECFKFCDKLLIFVNDISDNIENVKELFSEFDCDFIVHESNNFEFDTLNYLYEFSKENSGWNIGYIHTKGVTTGNNSCVDDWRKYMLYFIGKRYKECISLLESNDTVGVDLVNEPVLHYSGNFWWSKSDYIKTLPKPENIPVVLTSRHSAEFWICYNNGKHHSMHNSNINVYERHNHNYPERMYRRFNGS